MRLQKKKVRNGKSLSKYFNQIATYREFITDNEIRSTRRFETHREYHEALERGIISEEEPVIIGKIDEKAMKEAEERRERVESVWHAEIATSIKRSKEPMALPAPSSGKDEKEEKDSEFRADLKTDFNGILPEGERTDGGKQGEVNDKKAPDVEI